MDIWRQYLMCGWTAAGCLLQTEEAKHPLVVVVDITIHFQEKDYMLFETVLKKELVLYFSDTTKLLVPVLDL